MPLLKGNEKIQGKGNEILTPKKLSARLQQTKDENN